MFTFYTLIIKTMCQYYKKILLRLLVLNFGVLFLASRCSVRCVNVATSVKQQGILLSDGYCFFNGNRKMGDERKPQNRFISFRPFSSCL
jgi:hypothetical protein